MVTFAYEYRDMPLGVSIETEPARKSECVLHAKMTGDVALFGGSLIKEDGVYRLWYEAWLKDDFEKGDAGQCNALRYAESEDGFHCGRCCSKAAVSISTSAPRRRVLSGWKSSGRRESR